ncbi:hypothetical protein [Catalinimonas niigatensis]|uniref:hypothetical protein n=1 Tax=Catalinimonas niigatensis TaxID=1397264 RepID=UPI002666362A|nr:hypothetical protein [Catalinimonas niigatensis]WPP50925.1 hypothetical protein PZB72_00770 [Catalinimonas niigatensis]
MKFSYLFVLLVFWLTKDAYAQYFPSEVWHDGKITLLSGEDIQGKIKYNFESDLVQVNLNNTIQTYSARKILYFEIYDQEVERYRQFYALPFSVRPNYKVPMFFEVLYENTMTLLCRESVIQESIPQYGYYSYYGNRYTSRYRLAFDYYFLNKEGQIIPYSQKKDDLYAILTKNKDSLEKYVKENRLKYDRHRDLVRITAYYNSLLNS